MKQMQVDRFEENFVVLVDEEDQIMNLEKTFFDFEIHEGDIVEIEFSCGRPCSAKFLAEETEKAKERTRKLMERLKSKT